VAKFVGAAIGSIFAAVFPSECRLCRVPLANLSRLPVCDECLAKIIPIAGPRCSCCADPLPTGSLPAEAEQAFCAACDQEHPAFARASSYGAYLDELRELIHLLKYQQVRSAAGALGRLLVQAAEPLFSPASAGDGDAKAAAVLVLPVPLHAGKFRERGFNQAELIAQAALRELARVSGRTLEFDTSVLLRRRATESQVGMSREQRRDNIRGAFAASKEHVAGREVLLIDDVMTTGATVSECARVLHAAGARSVLVATVARSSKQSSWISAPADAGAAFAEDIRASYREEAAGAAVGQRGLPLT
jgi:ComF family protein